MLHLNEVVARTKAGDPHAFTLLVERYQRMAFGYAVSVLGDFDLAEDQEHSQREVAAFLNLPVTTVNNRLRAARNRLRSTELRSIPEDVLGKHRLPGDLAARTGQVVRADGWIIDACFPSDHQPSILSMLRITNEPRDVELTVQVAQHTDDGLVRCIAVPGWVSSSQSLPSDVRVVDTELPVQIPVGTDVLPGIVTSIRRRAAAPRVLETGIKVIDLLCPSIRRRWRSRLRRGYAGRQDGSGRRVDPQHRG